MNNLPTGIREQNDWLLNNGDSLAARAGIFFLVSFVVPATAGRQNFDWLALDEDCDGMSINRLRGYGLQLPVSESRIKEVCKATDWANCGWRHDLSWHNSDLDDPNDEVILAYQVAIHDLGLAWTIPANLCDAPFGRRLAQAAYPFDAIDANLHALGVEGSVEALLGEPPDGNRHAIVLITPNDD